MRPIDEWSAGFQWRQMEVAISELTHPAFAEVRKKLFAVLETHGSVLYREMEDPDVE